MTKKLNGGGITMKKKLFVILLTILVAVLCLYGLVACVGKDGQNGENGQDGNNGVGIDKVIINDNGELLIYDTNGKVIFQQKLPLCQHSYGDAVEGLKPTCTSAGYSYKTCKKCGEKDYETIPATGHSWNAGTTVNEADCTRNGLKYYSCTTCDQNKVEVIPATGAHKYRNDVCEYCNQTRAKILNNYYNGNYGYEYFLTLDKGDKLTKLYDVIDDKVMNFHDDGDANAQLNGEQYSILDIKWEEYGLTVDEAVSVWKTYLDDKPLYYWLAKSISVSGDALVLAIDEEYAQGTDRVAQNNKLYKTIDEYVKCVDGESAYSVAFAFHDRIIDKIDYAYAANGSPEDASWAHSIIGAFEKEKAVCEGYARAFQLLLNVFNIENVFVTGDSSNEHHAWNMVKLDDGKYYWYDLTFDDTPRSYWGISHNYACANDESFGKNHTADNSSTWGTDYLYDLPEASTTAYNGSEIKYLDKFTLEGTSYTVVGYDKLNITQITAGGNYVIPDKVTYLNRDFSVVSLMTQQDDSSYSVLDKNVKFVSIHIPASVVYIDENVFDCCNIENALETVTVDEKNPRFASHNGALFTKSLYTLIYYPHGNPQKEYAVPDETVFIAKTAFSNCLNLETLHIGKNLACYGIANWGYGYPDNSSTGGNIVLGRWNGLATSLQGKGQITVDPENEIFKVKDGLLMDCEETYVYAGLPYMEKIAIPDTVTEIESFAFNYLKKLKSIEIPEGVTKISGFSECVNLEEVILHEGLLEIGSHTFFNCHSIKSINLPNSLQSIGNSAFYGCDSLTDVTIPANVTFIDYAAFSRCDSLREIKVEQGNRSFTVQGNCLICTDTKTLIKGFDNSVIPNDGSVEKIGAYAFEFLNITEITIPDGITEIGAYAFSDCSSLKTLVIPESVRKIGENVTMDFSNDIFYKGTSEQWDKIDKKDAFIYQNPTVYFYSAEQPENEDNYWHYVDGVITKW